jgi:hypothetical protein
VEPPEAHVHAEQAERLRQSVIAFEQRHRHREHWFTLRLAMGYVAVVTLPLVCIIACFVILNYGQFGAKAVTLASGVLLSAVALLAAVWKQILSFPVDEEPPPPKSEPPNEGKG